MFLVSGEHNNLSFLQGALPVRHQHAALENGKQGMTCNNFLI